MIPHTITDAGRFSEERRDCAVRALAVCLGVPYAVAHARLASAGRRPRQGTKFAAWRKHLPGLGLESRPELSCMTLAKALPHMSRGRFVCRVARHFFAVVDGVVNDTHTQPPGRRLQMVYAPPES